MDSSVFFYFFRFLISTLLLGKSSFSAFIPPNSVPSIFVSHVPQATQFTLTERLVFRRKRKVVSALIWTIQAGAHE